MTDHSIETETETAAPNRKRKFFIGIAAFLAIVLGGGAAAAVAHKSVDVDIDGEVHEVATFASSVSGALDAVGFDPAPHDEVSPQPVDKLTNGETIVVRTAHQVEFDVNGETVELWTTGRTAGDAIADVDSLRRDVEFRVSRSSDGRPELDLPLVQNGDVDFKVDGETITETYADTVTLPEALEIAEIELGELDETVVTADEDATPIVEITRISVNEKKTTKVVKFETETRNNSSIYKGDKKVVQRGVNGERTIVTEITKVDGEVTEKEELSNKVTTKPVTHIIEVGTKARPAPAPAVAPSSGSTASSGSSGGGGKASSGGGGKASSGGGGKAPTSGVWGALAQCESGGNPSAVSASGTYHGLYQFSVATWNSVGGSGLPSQASAGEQLKRAKILQARSGWGQWPACSKQIGVR